MRYPDGGGLTARGQSRGEQVRLETAAADAAEDTAEALVGGIFREAFDVKGLQSG